MLPQSVWASSIVVTGTTLTVNSDAAGYLTSVAKTPEMKACTKIVLKGKFNASDLESIQAVNGTDFQATEVDMAEAKFVTSHSGGAPSQGNYKLYHSTTPTVTNPQTGDRYIGGGTLYHSAENVAWVVLDGSEGKSKPNEGTTVAENINTAVTSGYTTNSYGKNNPVYMWVQMSVTGEEGWSGPFNKGNNNFNEPELSSASELTLDGNESGSTNAAKEAEKLESVKSSYSTNQYVYFNRYYKSVQDNGNWYWRPATQEEYNAGSNKIDNYYGINLEELESGSDQHAAGSGNTMTLRVWYQKQGESRTWGNDYQTTDEDYRPTGEGSKTTFDGDYIYRNAHKNDIWGTPINNGDWVRLRDWTYYQLRTTGGYHWEKVEYTDGEEHWINKKYATESARTTDTEMPTANNQYAIVMGTTGGETFTPATEKYYTGSEWIDESGDTEISNYSDMKFSYWSSSLTKATTSKYADENISQQIFQNCNSLTEVYFKAGMLRDFGDHTSPADGLTVHVGQNVTKIAANAFIRCIALHAIDFEPGNGTDDVIPGKTYPLELVIDNGAFEQCVNLTGINIPNRVTSIGSSAFKNAGNNINTENGFEVSFQRRFEDEKQTIRTEGWRDGMNLTIGNDAFAYCSKLKDISLPIRMTSMGNGIFQNSGLESFKIREDRENALVTVIPSDAFLACKLKDINIPRSVNLIEAGAFSNTPTIETIRFQMKNSGTQTPLVIKAGAFSGGDEQHQKLKDVYVDFEPTDRLLICEYNAFNFTSMVGQTNESSTKFATLHFPNTNTAWDFYQGNWKRGLAFKQTNLNAFKDGYTGKWGGSESESNCQGMGTAPIGNDGKYHIDNVDDKLIAPANGWQQFFNTSTDIDIHIPTGSFMRTYSTNTAYVIPKFAQDESGNGITVHANEPMFRIYRISSFSDGFNEGTSNANSHEEALQAQRVATATEVIELDHNGRNYIPSNTGLLMVGQVNADYVVYFADADFTGMTEKKYPYFTTSGENTNLLYPTCINELNLVGDGTSTETNKAGQPSLNADGKIVVNSTIPFPYYNANEVLYRCFGYNVANNQFRRVKGAQFTRDKAYLKLTAAMFHWTDEYTSDTDNNNEVGNVTSSSRIAVEFTDDEESGTTGIKQVDTTAQRVDSNVFYTLEGVKLNSRPTQRGIYIHNGRKIIIK